MKVKLLEGRVGPRMQQHRGQVIDVPDVEAERLIAAGQAERTDDALTDRRVVSSTNPAVAAAEEARANAERDRDAALAKAAKAQAEADKAKADLAKLKAEAARAAKAKTPDPAQPELPAKDASKL